MQYYRQHKRVIILPWFIQTAGQSLGPDFMSLDKNPHAWVDVQNSSVRPERPPLGLPVTEEKVRPSSLTWSNFWSIQSTLNKIHRGLMFPWLHWVESHQVTTVLTLLQQVSQPSVCPGDPCLHPALVLCCPSASDYRWSQGSLLTKHNTKVSHVIIIYNNIDHHHKSIKNT